MPRPKVPSSQRQRATEACTFCRASKKKCSATVPCTHCLRRGIGDSCHLTHLPRGSRTSVSGYHAAPSPGLGAASEPSRAASPKDSGFGRPGFTPIPPANWDLNSAAETTPRPQGLQSFSSRAEADPAQGQPPPPSQRTTSLNGSVPREPRSRMLLNLSGERVYIGGAASLSFLQLVREIVSEQIGPSQFSHNDKSDSMLETESPESSANVLVPAVVDLDVDQKLLYSQVFHTVAGGLLDVFSSSEVEGLLVGSNDYNAPSISPCKRATIVLIVAIGAQCKSPSSARQVGQPYFHQAQKYAFAGMLENPSVEMVRAFLLMAFYALGECRRNAAYMYLGVASRAAIALGLHSRESYSDMSSPKYQLRLKIWMSLCILDRLVSSILGRPSATASLRSDLGQSMDDMLTSAADHDTALLIASYKIASIIHEVVDSIYVKKEISGPIVEQFLDRIEKWSRELPESLRTSSTMTAATDPKTQKGTVGNIHISCLYYFAVTLATRPILISTLTAQLGSHSPTQTQLASACLDAAIFLVQACVDAYTAGMLLGNMCIIKALVFAAGLITGFNMFAGRELDYESETAFRGAREVLDFLALQSPQAAHYAGILTLLSNAITKKRENMASRGRSKYVGRLFRLGSTKDDGEESRRSGTDSDSTVLASASEQGETGGDISWLIDQQKHMPIDMEGGELLLGWDSLDLPQWDNFPLLSPRSLELG